MRPSAVASRLVSRHAKPPPERPPQRPGLFLFWEQIREAAPFGEPRILMYVRRDEGGCDKVAAPE